MSDPVIDLGELRHGAEPEERLPRPPRAAGRPLRGALVLLLLLATLVSATPLARREVVSLPAALGSEALIAGDLYLVVEPTGADGSQRRLDAYRLPGGERIWQAPLPVPGRYWGMSLRDGMLLIAGYEVTEGDPPGTVTIALDPATGQFRWQQPGSPLPVKGGGLLLETSDAEQGGTLRVVDSCCGRVRWRADTPAGQLTFRSTEAGVDRLVHSTADGQVVVRDAATGAVLAEADLWNPAGRREVSVPTDGLEMGVQVVGDLLLTLGGWPMTVTAYGLDRLDRRWRTELDGAAYSSECGPVLCFQGRSGDLQALDPATGRRLWTGAGWIVWSTGAGLMAGVGNDSGADRLVVLDPVTGAVRGQLGRWEVVPPSVAGGPFIGVRPRPGGGLLVAELDLVAGAARPLDVLPEASGNCQSIGYQLACRKPAGGFGLWRLKP
ncbi:outer membrane protein assembly factor BamB family protein [Micromonospora avicenniae]|uniref:outer membrane protein assembly factor BamB family protein n=1 Tax=Micromonospora avicenniae TaxID=1198245 RepID=UPI00341FB5C3